MNDCLDVTKTYILVNKELVEEPDLEKHYTWFSNKKNTVLKQTQLEDSREVSTMFLGVDYSFLYNQTKPVFFVTTVDNGLGDTLFVTSSTWDEAEKTHEMVVEFEHELLSKIFTNTHNE